MYVLKAMSLQEHQDSESAEGMGHTDFDNGLDCNFGEDSPPLSSILQHSPFPPHTTTSEHAQCCKLLTRYVPGIQVKGESWKFFNLTIC
jgi:hypothetical protein